MFAFAKFVLPPWAEVPLPVCSSWVNAPDFQPKPDGLERRQGGRRVPCRLIAHVHATTPTGRREFRALLRDVSDTGLSLEATLPIPVGAILEVELFDALGQQYARIEAEVVHSDVPTPAGYLLGCVVRSRTAAQA
jgi:hypothetical protein